MTTQYTPSTTSNVSAGSRGRTTVTPLVVATVAGLAAAEVTGMRAHPTRVDRRRSRSSRSRRGVTARVHQGHTSLRLDVVADYGLPIAEVAADLRRAVGAAVHAHTGMTVDAIDIAVHDVVETSAAS